MLASSLFRAYAPETALVGAWLAPDCGRANPGPRRTNPERELHIHVRTGYAPVSGGGGPAPLDLAGFSLAGKIGAAWSDTRGGYTCWPPAPILKPLSGHTSCASVYRYLTKNGRTLARDFPNVDAPQEGDFDWAAVMGETRHAYRNDTP